MNHTWSTPGRRTGGVSWFDPGEQNRLSLGQASAGGPEPMDEQGALDVLMNLAREGRRSTGRGRRARSRGRRGGRGWAVYVVGEQQGADLLITTWMSRNDQIRDISATLGPVDSTRL